MEDLSIQLQMILILLIPVIKHYRWGEHKLSPSLFKKGNIMYHSLKDLIRFLVGVTLVVLILITIQYLV